MNKNLLVLVFGEDHEISGIPKCLVFNNQLDAEDYLLNTAKVTKIEIEPENRWFSFKDPNNYDGYGKAYWAKDMTV